MNNELSHTSSRGAYEAQSHNEQFWLTQEDIVPPFAGELGRDRIAC
jgi:hypothetical protein